jgi:hypothetical protein
MRGDGPAGDRAVRGEQMVRTGRQDGGRATSGQTLPLVAVFMMSLLLAAGLTIDLGNAYRVKQSLQASAEAAAAAGADNLPDPSSAVAAARAYASGAGGKDSIAGAGPVSVTAKANCATGPRFCAPANTIQVTESADVPTYLLHLIGVDHVNVSVHAQACSPCGALPLDVMVVLDRSGSMTGQKLAIAKHGVLSFLGDMDPTLDKVGLVVLPPAASMAAKCGPGLSVNYNLASAAYLLVPLSKAYASSVGNLNQSSDLVSTLNCVQPGGGTAYGNALDAAQAELDRDGRQGVQKVIIFLAGGGANTGPSYLPATSPYRTNPCRQSIKIAAGSKAAGVLVYSIGYDMAVEGAKPCYAADGSKEMPAITGNQAMHQIATPGNSFYEPQATQLVGVFNAITQDLSRGTSRING